MLSLTRGSGTSRRTAAPAMPHQPATGPWRIADAALAPVREPPMAFRLGTSHTVLCARPPYHGAARPCRTAYHAGSCCQWYAPRPSSLPPVGRGSGRPWPVAYPVPRATRRKKGLPGAWAVLFQRAVGSDPAGCASRRAHRVETAIAFRLHNALGTQNERYFVAVNPTAHSLACLRIGVFVTADAARLAPGVGGSPCTGRVSHPLDGKQSFMTSPHRHSPLTSLAWSHRAPTPRIGSAPTLEWK